MANNSPDNFKEWILGRWETFFERSGDDTSADVGREKIVVFVVALVLAMCLWLMINLSRDYNLSINLPISPGNIPEDQSLAEELPSFATVSVNGEGWKLISVYNNPPLIYVDLIQDEINLFDQIQQQMNNLPNVTVQKVQPLTLNPEIEEKVSKKVPVKPRVEVAFGQRYDVIDSPQVSPDSIMVSGASSLVDTIESWPTDSVTLSDITGNISEKISLKAPSSLIDISETEITYSLEVEEFTEGEAKVFIQTNNLPQGRMVSFSPSFITVKYDVPIDQYSEVKDFENLFTAYVDYDRLQQDSSGFIEPVIELIPKEQFNITIKSSQPRKVAYFMVVGN